MLLKRSNVSFRFLGIGIKTRVTHQWITSQVHLRTERMPVQPNALLPVVQKTHVPIRDPVLVSHWSKGHRKLGSGKQFRFAFQQHVSELTVIVFHSETQWWLLPVSPGLWVLLAGFRYRSVSCEFGILCGDERGNQLPNRYLGNCLVITTSCQVFNAYAVVASLMLVAHPWYSLSWITWRMSCTFVLLLCYSILHFVMSLLVHLHSKG